MENLTTNGQTTGMLNIINLEKSWTKKTSPDIIRGTFNSELLRRVIEAKLEQCK
jgi:hypothetical protein